MAHRSAPLSVLARVGLLLLAAAIGIAVAGRASAGPEVIAFTVTDVSSEPDANPGDGACLTADQFCSVNAAVQEYLAGSATSGRIEWNLSPSGPGFANGFYTTALTTGIPTITKGNLTIDAETQPGFSGDPVVLIDGDALAPGGFIFRTFNVDNVVIRGLRIDGARDDGATQSLEGAGILFQGGSGNVAEDNWLGFPGTSGATQVQAVGAWVVDGENPVIRNNTISNNATGVRIQRATGTEVLGNNIGLTPDGDEALANGNGIQVIDAPDTLIRNNTISGNNTTAQSSGIYITNFTPDGGTLTIDNNTIGGNDTVTLPVPNSNGVVFAPAANNVQSYDAIVVTGNVFSGNTSDGFDWFGLLVPEDGLTFEGNFVGVDETGFGVNLRNGHLGAGFLFPVVPNGGAVNITDSTFGYNTGTNLLIDLSIPDSVAPGSTVSMPLTLSEIESHNSGENGAVFNVHLREGINWSDGTPITAADVEFTQNVIDGYGLYVDAEGADSGMPNLDYLGWVSSGNGGNGVTLDFTGTPGSSVNFSNVNLSDFRLEGNGGYGLYYNAAIFDEAGLDYPEANWTWDDLRAAANQLSGIGVDVTVPAGDWALANWYLAGLDLIGNGGDGLTVDISSPDTQAALQWYREMAGILAADNGGNGARIHDAINVYPAFEGKIDASTFTGNEGNGLIWQFSPPGLVPDVRFNAQIDNSIFEGNGQNGAVLEYDPAVAQQLLDEAGWTLEDSEANGNGASGVRVVIDSPGGTLLGLDIFRVEAALNIVRGVEFVVTDAGAAANYESRGATIREATVVLNGQEGVVYIVSPLIPPPNRVSAAQNGDGNPYPVSAEQNIIYKNGGLGIDLGGDGADTNDAGDPDEGPNGHLNRPELISAAGVGTTIDIEGQYDGPANTEVRIEFFANGLCDPTNAGEGAAYIGSVTVNTNGSGHAVFNENFAETPPGQYITATATTTEEGTSELSNCIKGQGLGTPGDTDCDEDADALDALGILANAAGLSGGACVSSGDVDCDGDTDAADATIILADEAGVPMLPGPGCWPVA